MMVDGVSKQIVIGTKIQLTDGVSRELIFSLIACFEKVVSKKNRSLCPPKKFAS